MNACECLKCMAVYKSDECGVETQSSWSTRIGHAREAELQRATSLEAKCAEQELALLGYEGRCIGLEQRCAWQAEMIERAAHIIEMVETVDEPIEDWLADLEKGTGEK